MTLDEWLEYASKERRIIGVVLTGSRGRGAMVHDASDWDLRVAVVDGEERFADSLDTPHGSELEISAATLSAFRAWPDWDRYSFAHAKVLLDKLDGEFARVVSDLGTLAGTEALARAREALGAYTNSLYRSLRNTSLGLSLAAQLDAARAIDAFLEAIFAFEGRVRPFNKYLVWELESHPLSEWNSQELPELIEGALTGAAERQRELFRAAEPQIRRHGLGDVIDDWDPHVAFLRGVR